MTITTECKCCGNEFSWEKPEGTRGRLRRFCSPECRKENARNRARSARSTPIVSKLCCICGLMFVTGYRQKKTCGHVDCTRALNAVKTRRFSNRPRATGKCGHCGVVFAITINRAAFCSRSCANAAHSAKRATDAVVPCNTCQGMVMPSALRHGDCKACRQIRRDDNALRRVVSELLRMHGKCRVCSREFSRNHAGRKLCPECKAESTLVKRREYRKRRKHRARVQKPSSREVFSSIDVFNRDGWRCQLCGCRVRQYKRKRNMPREATIDHIIPLSRGGQHSIANCHTACRDCNSRKAAQKRGQMRLV